MAANKRPPFNRRKKVEVSKATKRRKGLRCIKQPTFLHLCEACAALSPAFAIRKCKKMPGSQDELSIFRWRENIFAETSKIEAGCGAKSSFDWMLIFMLSSRDNKELMDLRGSFCHPCSQGSLHMTPYNSCRPPKWHLSGNNQPPAFEQLKPCA